MKFSETMYFGEGVKHKKIRNKIQKKKMLPGVYCICLNPKSTLMLEIMEVKELYKEINDMFDYTIIGIAIGEDQALELIQAIIGEVYFKTGSLETFLDLDKRRAL